MVRRHLGFTIDEWESLPWWQQRVYVESLAEEFGGDQSREGRPSADRVLDLDQDGPDVLAQFGMVQQVV